MNFISNVLDAIPVVGHAKAVIHYAAGDEDGGNKALYQSTRTSAVLAGGAIGSIAGPAGAVAAAAYAGCLSDCVASATMGEPQGLIQDFTNVGNDIKRGKNPTMSLLTTGVHVGLDAVGGLGMGGISSASASNVGKKIASDVGGEIIEKSVKLTVEEAAKITTRKVSEAVVKKTVEKAVIQAEIALVSTHICGRAVEAVKEERNQAEQEKDDDGDKKKTTKKENNEKKADKDKKSEKETGKKTQSRRNTGIGSGGQPPQRDKGDNKKIDECIEPDFSNFLKLLKKFLETICAREDITKFYRIFQNLSLKQKEYLVKLIKNLTNFGSLEAVLKLVIQIFALHFPSDFTFANFLSLMEFVQTYINNEIEERIMYSQGTEATQSRVPFEERRAKLISDVISELGILGKIVWVFNYVRVQIESENANNPVYPNFRDIFSAVYHYFKHRLVPGDGILSVKEYYGWIRRLLKEIKILPEFADLHNPLKPREEIVYELYVVAFGRRIRIIVKIQGDVLVLCSCFVVYMIFYRDKEGDVFIDRVRKL